MLYTNKGYPIYRKEFKWGGFVKGISIGDTKIRGANQIFLPVPLVISNKYKFINGFNKEWSIGVSKKGYPKITASHTLNPDKTIYLILTTNVVNKPVKTGTIEYISNNSDTPISIPEDKIIANGIGRDIENKIKYQELLIKSETNDIYKVNWTDDVEPFYYFVNSESVDEVPESDLKIYLKENPDKNNDYFKNILNNGGR